jgi:hypothetical protein
MHRVEARAKRYEEGFCLNGNDWPADICLKQHKGDDIELVDVSVLDI